MTTSEPDSRGDPHNQPGAGASSIPARIQLVTLTDVPADKSDAAQLTESARLLACLTENFSMEELRVVVSALEIDWGEIAGTTKSSKAADLIDYLRRRDKLIQLDAYIRHSRPDVFIRNCRPERDIGILTSENILLRYTRTLVKNDGTKVIDTFEVYDRNLAKDFYLPRDTQ